MGNYESHKADDAGNGNGLIDYTEQISLGITVENLGVEGAAREVDVVTTGTFGAMCSSGLLLNLGHSEPPIKIQKLWFNNERLIEFEWWIVTIASIQGSSDPQNRATKILENTLGAFEVSQQIKEARLSSDYQVEKLLKKLSLA